MKIREARGHKQNDVLKVRGVLLLALFELAFACAILTWRTGRDQDGRFRAPKYNILKIQSATESSQKHKKNLQGGAKSTQNEPNRASKHHQEHL